MSIDQFLEALRATPAFWHPIRKGSPRIRCAGNTCPIVAVAGGIGPYAWDYVDVLGLTPRDAWAIVSAADESIGEGNYDQALRRALLAATVEWKP